MRESLKIELTGGWISTSEAASAAQRKTVEAVCQLSNGVVFRCERGA